jgi:hypothetical protein
MERRLEFLTARLPKTAWRQSALQPRFLIAGVILCTSQESDSGLNRREDVVTGRT